MSYYGFKENIYFFRKNGALVSLIINWEDHDLIIRTRQHHYSKTLPEFLHLAGVRVLALPGGGVEVLLEGVQPDPVPVDGPQAAARLLSLQAATAAEPAASEPATSSKSAATTKSSVAVSVTASTKAPISISVSSVSRHPEHKGVLTLAPHITPNSLSKEKKQSVVMIASEPT